ncbi:MAG: hypothetical protein SW833_24305 [Cyanobacteriota bacterium]|nr:hypothetical protein [Cyanobacteriota bacterium]
MQRLSEMTIADLRALILQILREQRQQYTQNRPARSLDEVLDSIDAYMWTPPSGAKSTMELLREDRDR